MMRKFILIITLFAVLFCGCYGATAEKSQNYSRVTINMPEDNTVNGYKTSSFATDTMPDKINGSDTAVETANNTKNKSSGYCGNKNSKVFHKSTCSSVASMSEANKVYLSGRDEFISKGYKPCGRCNP